MKKAPSSTVEQHFADRPKELYEIYLCILGAVKKFGSVRVEAKKTSIHLCNKSAFLGIRTMSKCLAITIKSDADLDSDRVCEHEQTSANRWHLLVKLHSKKEIDKELRSWFRRAYELSE